LSHLKERKEKNCLNCNAQVQGRFCHICGQENVETKESAWHLVSHFFQDITHFDGKFFTSVKLLITRPGFLAREYTVGRRASYLNPIRLYVFTSAFFFLIFFSLYTSTEHDFVQDEMTYTEAKESLLASKKVLLDKLSTAKDTTAQNKFSKRIKNIDSDLATLEKDTTQVDNIRSIKTTNFGIISFVKNYRSVAHYDSVQNALPGSQRDGWVTNKIFKKLIIAREKYKGDAKEVDNAVYHKFQHNFPQLLFLSLPFFALILKLLYIRRKQFYYVNHAIFTIYLYCAFFILLLIIFGINQLKAMHYLGIYNWLVAFLITWMVIYLYKAMRNFYQQRRAKTIVKFILLNFIMFIVYIILMSLVFIFSAYQI